MSYRIQLSVDDECWPQVLTGLHVIHPFMLHPSGFKSWSLQPEHPTRKSHLSIHHWSRCHVYAYKICSLVPSCVMNSDLWGRTWKVNEEWKIWNLENLSPIDVGFIIRADFGEKHIEEADGWHDSSSGETAMSLMWIVHMTSSLSCWVITLSVTVQIFVHSRVQRTFLSRSL